MIKFPLLKEVRMVLGVGDPGVVRLHIPSLFLIGLIFVFIREN